MDQKTTPENKTTKKPKEQSPSLLDICCCLLIGVPAAMIILNMLFLYVINYFEPILHSTEWMQKIHSFYKSPIYERIRYGVFFFLILGSILSLINARRSDSPLAKKAKEASKMVFLTIAGNILIGIGIIVLFWFLLSGL